jgi:hypothetical protein
MYDPSFMKINHNLNELLALQWDDLPAAVARDFCQDRKEFLVNHNEVNAG